MWRYVLTGVMTMCAGTAAAQVYECTSAQGVKQYAQFCPPGTVQQRQIGKAGDGGGEAAAPAQPAAPKSVEAQEVEYRKRLLERQEAEAKAAQEKSRAAESERNCTEARAQLQAIEEGKRMSRFDPVTGERVQFGDDERAEEADRQRSAIAQWCK